MKLCKPSVNPPQTAVQVSQGLQPCEGACTQASGGTACRGSGRCRARSGSKRDGRAVPSRRAQTSGGSDDSLRFPASELSEFRIVQCMDRQVSSSCERYTVRLAYCRRYPSEFIRERWHFLAPPQIHTNSYEFETCSIQTALISNPSQLHNPCFRRE